MRYITLSSAVILLLGACSETPTETEMKTVKIGEMTSVETIHKNTANDYLLKWDWKGAPEPVTISIATQPDALPKDQNIIAQDLEATEFSYSADDEKHRRYFFITPKGGETVKTAVRLLPLEGGRNFRDLGGYETAAGQTVKWGKLFRSGMMADLTANDYRYLSDLDIQTLCDFRTVEERKSEPTEWKAGNAEYLTFPDPVEEMGESSFTAIFSDPELTAEKVAQGMANQYPQIAKDQTPAYTAMFDRLAAGEIPLSFNCSAGKDRAGTAAALILTALGVPRETVIKDYALSETYVDYMKAFFGEEGTEGAEDEPEAYAFLRQLPREIVAPLMRSDPRYIQTTFEWMDKEYGGAMNFIQSELDVTDAELTRIRAQLLE